MKQKPLSKMTFSEWVGVSVLIVVMLALKEYIYNVAHFWGISYSYAMFWILLAGVTFLFYRYWLTERRALDDAQRAAELEEVGHA